MKQPLTPAELSRFESVLHLMFNPGQPGEQAAAASRLEAMLRTRELEWRDVITIVREPERQRETPRSEPQEPDEDGWETPRWKRQVLTARQYPGLLFPREIGFLADLAFRWQGPTPRQQAWLDKIVERLRGRGVAI